jgi:hypothetical protein
MPLTTLDLSSASIVIDLDPIDGRQTLMSLTPKCLCSSAN